MRSCSTIITDRNNKIKTETLSQAFNSSCENGHVSVAKYLYNISKMNGNKKININSSNNHLFFQGCINGHKSLVEWLYNTSKIDKNTKININLNNNYAFRKSCECGKVEIAEYLHNLSKCDEHTKINIGDYNYCFKIACRNNQKKWQNGCIIQ